MYHSGGWRGVSEFLWGSNLILLVTQDHMQNFKIIAYLLQGWGFNLGLWVRLTKKLLCWFILKPCHLLLWKYKHYFLPAILYHYQYGGWDLFDILNYQSMNIILKCNTEILLRKNHLTKIFNSLSNIVTTTSILPINIVKQKVLFL